MNQQRALFVEIAAGDLTSYRTQLPSVQIVCSDSPISGQDHCFPDSELQEAEILSVMVHSRVSRSVMEAMPKLRLIATRSTGYDHIDVEAATERGITVATVPEYGSATVAEYTFGLILNLSRRIHTCYMQTAIGGLSGQGIMGRDLEGRCLGVVGLGKIGRKVARIAAGFGMNVLATDPTVTVHDASVAGADLVSFEYLLRSSDIVAVCCPLVESTHHLLNDWAFDAMKPGVQIVNTARGGIVDTHALLRALHGGKVSGAALDVLEDEEHVNEESALLALCAGQPISARLLATNLALLRHPNVLITPHMAYFTREALDRIHKTTADNIASFLEGKPVNTVAAANRELVTA